MQYGPSNVTMCMRAVATWCHVHYRVVHYRVDASYDAGSVDSTAEYKLSLISSCQMPANVTTMVLYCFTKNVPIVRTICQWDIRAAAEPVWRAKPVWTAKCCPAKSSAVKHQMSEGHVTGFGLRANNV